MATLPHVFSEQVTNQTHTGDTNWTTKHTIAASNFDAGGTYLIIAWAQVGGSATNRQVGIRLAHGTTPTAFTESEHVFEPQTTSDANRQAYQTALVFTQPGTAEDVVVQLRCVLTGTDTVRADTIAITCLKISALTSGDYAYDSDTPNLTHTTSFQSTGSSVTITSAASEKWLVIAAYRVDVAILTNQIQHRINRDSATETVPQTGWEAEQADETLTGVLIRPYTLSSGSHTFTLEARDAASAGNITTHSFIIALRLAAFTDADYNYTAGTVTATGAANITVEFAALNPTPSVTQDVLILAYGTVDMNTNASRVYGRIQIGGTTHPTGSDANSSVASNDPTNDTGIPLLLMTVENLANSAQDIDADFGDGFVGTATIANRCLVAIGMEYTPPAAPSAIAPPVGAWAA